MKVFCRCVKGNVLICTCQVCDVHMFESNHEHIASLQVYLLHFNATASKGYGDEVQGKKGDEWYIPGARNLIIIYSFCM